MKSKDSIKVVFFDLDNTLWDFEKNSRLAMKELYDERIKALDKSGAGYSKFMDMFEAINEDLWEDYRCGRVTKEELRKLRFYKSLKNLGIDDKLFAEEIEGKYVSGTASKPNLVDNALDVLKFYKGKYRLGIITNGFIEAQEVKMKSSNIKSYFDYIIVSENAGYNKPDRRIFDFALKTAGINSSEAVFVGDEYDVDMLGAQNAGIKGIWFNRKNTVNTKLYDCIEIFSLSDLYNII